jgi:uncharacterized protein YcgI (DUF1989 family)
MCSQQGNSESVVVPAQEGRAVLVHAGELVEVVDVEGAQVADVWAIDANDHTRWLSTSYTRDYLERLFPEWVSVSLTSGTSRLWKLFLTCRPALMTCCFRHAIRRYTIAKVSLGMPIARTISARFPLAARSRPGDGVTLRAARDVLVVVTACAVDFWPTNGDRCGPLRITVRRAARPSDH